MHLKTPVSIAALGVAVVLHVATSSIMPLMEVGTANGPAFLLKSDLSSQSFLMQSTVPNDLLENDRFSRALSTEWRFSVRSLDEDTTITVRLDDCEGNTLDEFVDVDVAGMDGISFRSMYTYDLAVCEGEESCVFETCVHFESPGAMTIENRWSVDMWMDVGPPEEDEEPFLPEQVSIEFSPLGGE